MRLCRLVCSVSCALAALCAALLAADNHEEFLQALRARGYYDTAFDYLDEMAKRNDISDELRTSIEFERALTLLQSSQLATSEELRSSQFEKAAKLLEQFAQSHPQHPLAARANFERGRSQFENSRLSVAEAEVLPNKEEQSAALEKARGKIEAARTVLQTSHDAFKATFESLEADAASEKRAAREMAERYYLLSQMCLAKADFEEARTYAFDASERTKRDELLANATKRFTAVDERYRTQIVGREARLWLGMCYQLRGEIGRALGIFDELLQDTSDVPAAVALKNEVELQRLKSLNHESRKDYPLVVAEAKFWLDQDRKRARQPVGLGVRRELALAYESLATKNDTPADEKNRNLRQALEEAREIGKSPGRYRKEAQRMVSRFEAALGKEAGDPKNFQAANTAARAALDLAVDKKKQVDAAAENSDDRNRLQSEYEQQLGEAERNFKLALELADASTKLADLNGARYRLAYINHLLGANYDAAVLAEYVGRHGDEVDAETAANAAYLSMHAWLQLYRQAPKTDNLFEEQQVVRSCQWIMTDFAESKHANDARLQLANVFRVQGNPIEGARLIAQVPETSEQFPQAQIESGKAYWQAWYTAASSADEKKTPPEELQKWIEEAKSHLKTGIDKLAERESMDAATRETYVSGKATLASVLVQQDDYAGAIELLAGASDPVIDAVAVADGEQRPDEGVQSRKFAADCYALLLRCYVGTQQIDKALETMSDFESVVGSDAADVSTYRQLGEQLQQEISRLAEQKDEKRLANVRGAYEQFLAALLARKSELSFNVLRWMAEAYTALADGLAATHPADARADFGKAAEIYEVCLQHKEAPPGSELPLKLRLLTTRRRQGDFEAGAKLVDEIVAQKPQWLDLQVEAATLFEEWGSSGDGQNYRKIVVAIEGNGTNGAKGTVWGWDRIAGDFLRSLNARKLSEEKRTEYQSRYYDARYRSIAARRQYGLKHPDKTKGQQSLDATKGELENLALLEVNVDPATKGRFNMLYRTVLGDLGLRVADLSWDKGAGAQPKGDVAKKDTPAQAKSPGPSQPAAANAPPVETAPGNDTLLVVSVIVLTLAAGAGTVFMMLRNSRTRRSRRRSVVGKASSGDEQQMSATAAASPARKPASTPTQPRPGQGGPSQTAVKRPPNPGS